MNRRLLFSEKIWVIISTVILFLTCCAVVGTTVAQYYKTDINIYLGCKTYKLVETGDTNVDTNYFPSDYLTARGEYNDHALFNAALDIGEKVATEGAVLLKNDNNALPLYEGQKVHLFGISAAKYLYCGYGSGEILYLNSETLNSALEAKGLIPNGILWDFYTKGKGSVYGRTNYRINEVPWSLYDNTVLDSLNDSNAAAVVVLSRTDGEAVDLNGFDNDGIDNNYLQLSEEENDLLRNLVQLKSAGKFGRLVLVLNSACAMQMDLISMYGEIDSIVCAGIGGTMATQALANILAGEHNPSGRLTDSYLYDNYSAPATENFGDFKFANADDYPLLNELTESNVYEKNNRYMVLQEGIYVGYRYFETRYSDLVTKSGNAISPKGVKAGKGGSWDYSAEVAYPFGFGLSYTQFEYSGFTVSESEKDFTVSLVVTNTGEYSGKEVVQIYLQKPYTVYDEINKIEKPAVELAGIFKTRELSPAASEAVSVIIDKAQLKTYDANASGTYILESGDYYLAAGKNAHDALNNILSINYSVSDGMTYRGNPELIEKIAISDEEGFSVAESNYTGEVIKNRFDDADLNKYKGSGGQKVVYLSRSDWDATYPVGYVLKCTDIMYQDILYKEGGTLPDITDESLPEFNKDNGLTLMMLKNAEYVSEEWDDLIDQLTYNECLDMILKSATFTQAIESVSSPAVRCGDGPAGLVKRDSQYTYAYPSQVLMGSTFDVGLVKELGECFGLELLHNGYTMIYAPGANIHRSAYSGRNWEYYSEDGFLSGEMLASECEGITNKGGIVTAKHFALNDQETNRNGVCTFTNEQAIRELYLKCFEKGITSGKINALMSSFNRIGAIWAGAHSGLLTGVLRNEWGFKGFVKTDALCSPYMTQYANAVVAGNDMWMADTSYSAVQAFEKNPVFLNAVKKSAKRILYTILHSNAMNGISETTKVVKILAWWEIGFISIDIVFGILFVFSAVMLFVSKKRAAVLGAVRDIDRE